MKSVKFKGIDVFYKTYGSAGSPVVVLLHGYLESMEIMQDLANSFSTDYFVITPDLPGHGLSGVYNKLHSMDDLAESVVKILDLNGIEKIHLVGHSMGGYVTMAFRDIFPERLLSFILLHSHCFSDSEEKKVNREKEIEMIKKGKKELIIRTNIPNIYANDNLECFSTEVERSISIAMKTPEEGIIAMLGGMKERSDRAHLLEEGGIPSLMFAGMKDNHIPVDLVERIMVFARDMKRIDLKKSGHMGFIEEKKEVVAAIREFYKNK